MGLGEITMKISEKNRERLIFTSGLVLIICYSLFGFYKHGIPIFDTIKDGFAGVGLGFMVVEIIFGGGKKYKS